MAHNAATGAPQRKQPSYLKVVFSPGVVPDKWFNRFDERTWGWRAAGAQADDPLKYVASGAADIAILRLPAGQADAGQNYHHVRLYDEQIGVAAPKDHPIKVVDMVALDDLQDEMVMYSTPSDGVIDISAVREALTVVAANVGVCIAPRPLLRALNQPGVVHRDLHGVDPHAGNGLSGHRGVDPHAGNGLSGHRGVDPHAGNGHPDHHGVDPHAGNGHPDHHGVDPHAGNGLTDHHREGEHHPHPSPEAPRTVQDTPQPGGTRVALVWLKEHDSDQIQDFVGICRGRKESSGRQQLTKRQRRPSTRKPRRAR